MATAERRPGAAESAAGAPAPPGEARSAVHVVRREPPPLPGAAAATPPRPASREPLELAPGYWHWDGVQWVWQAPRWQRRRAPWRWQR